MFARFIRRFKQWLRSMKCYFGFHKSEMVKYSHVITKKDGSPITAVAYSYECVYCGKADKSAKANTKDEDIYCC